MRKGVIFRASGCIKYVWGITEYVSIKCMDKEKSKFENIFQTRICAEVYQQWHNSVIIRVNLSLFLKVIKISICYMTEQTCNV